MGVIACGLQAQFRPPQPERKTPRAVGVLETFKNGSRRLVPVTFFYERHYYDASFYHATPVPFTLVSQTVYEVQQYGQAVGTFTVLSATANADQSAAQDTDQKATAWFGNGRYKAAADAAAVAKKKASARAAAARAVVSDDPSRPVLHRRAGSEGDNPVAHPVAASATAEAEEDPERPRLQRREGSGGDRSASAQTEGQDSAKAGGAGAQAETQAGGGQTGEGSVEDSDRPKLHRGDDSGNATASTTQATTKAETQDAAERTPDEDPEHPILRRGRAGQEQSGPDLPEVKPVATSGSGARVTSSATGGVTGSAAGAASEATVTRQVAVSDAGPSEAQSLIYICREEQRRQMETAARELAEAELRRVAAQRGLVLPAPTKAALGKAQGKTASTKVGAGKKNAAGETAALPELKLEEEQFVPYDLEYDNFATVVFSGRYVQQAASAQGAASTVTGAPGVSGPAKSWVVTVIAREDEGKLVKLYSAVSDPRELDLYPEVRLVDAVDPEGYGHYGLLFRERKRDGVSWLLGRMTGYELQTVFETAVR